MSLSQQDIIAIRSTWAFAASNPQSAGRLFYARLFEIAPSARALFPEGMAAQELKLIQTLDVVVDSLDRLGDLAPELTRLGDSHAALGAEPAHYDLVGEALLWTLGELAGGSFNADARAAWTRAYGYVAGEMMAAGQTRA